MRATSEQPQGVDLLGRVVGGGRTAAASPRSRRHRRAGGRHPGLGGGRRPQRLERDAHAPEGRIHLLPEGRDCLSLELALACVIERADLAHARDEGRHQRVGLGSGAVGVVDHGERALEQRRRQYDSGLRLALHVGGRLVELDGHRLQALHVVARSLVVAHDVRRLQEARQLCLDAEHGTDRVQRVVRRQPGKALDRERGLVLVEQDVVGDLILACQPGAIEAVNLAYEPLEQRIVLGAGAQGEGGELVRVVIEDRAVGDADGGEDLRVAHQELEGLPVGELIDGEGLAPHDPVRAVAEYRHAVPARSRRLRARVLSCATCCYGPGLSRHGTGARAPGKEKRRREQDLLPAALGSQRCAQPPPLLVRRMKSATLSCSCFSEASLAYTMWPDS